MTTVETTTHDPPPRRAERSHPRLAVLLRREPRGLPTSDWVIALSYLAQHLHDPIRRSDFVAYLHTQWPTLTSDAGTVQWLTRFWPEVVPPTTPHTVPAPDPIAIRAWVRHPLFGPLGERRL